MHDLPEINISDSCSIHYTRAGNPEWGHISLSDHGRSVSRRKSNGALYFFLFNKGKRCLAFHCKQTYNSTSKKHKKYYTVERYVAATPTLTLAFVFGTRSAALAIRGTPSGESTHQSSVGISLITSALTRVRMHCEAPEDGLD